MKKRLMSVLLALAMVITMMPTTAFAAEKDTINYVSLGDSMTNGYGLEGYDGNNGFMDYGEEAYPNQFAKWLVEAGYAKEVKHSQFAMSAMRAEDLHFILEFPVDDAKALAVAEMKEWDEEKWNAKFTTGDYYTWNELCDNYRFQDALNDYLGWTYDDDEDGETAEIAGMYQDAVEKADIISVGIGNGNFGVFMMGRIMESIGFDGEPSEAMIYKVERALAECDPELQAQIMELRAELEPKLDEVLAEQGIDAGSDMFVALKNTFLYGCLSFVLNYAGSIEAILQLNGDAEIILVGLMNTMAGMEMTIPGVEEPIDMADVLGVLIDPMNVFIAALPTYMQATGNSVYANATFYYAEASKVECLVETYGEDIAAGNAVVRERFVTEIVGECDCWDSKEKVWECEEHGCTKVEVDGNEVYCCTVGQSENGCVHTDGMVWPMIGPMFNNIPQLAAMQLGLVSIDLQDIQAYEGGTLTDPSKILSCAVYLAFEEAIVIGSQDSKLTLETFTSLATGLGSAFDGVGAQLMGALDFDAITEEVTNAVMADAIAGATEYKKNLTDLKADTFAYIIENQASEFGALAPVVAHYAMTNPGGPLTQDAVTAWAMAEYDAPYHTACVLGEDITPALTTALTSDDTLMGLLHLFGRMLIGNGLGAHPSVAGHKELADAVIESYRDKHTAADQTKENLIFAAEVLAGLVAEYYDEAYEYAYAEAKAAGYIDTAAAGIDAVIAELAAIDLSETQMTEEFKAELMGEIEEIIETLEKAKELIYEADVLDQATLDALMATLDEGGEAIENLLNLLKQAGDDVTELVIVPALEKAYDELVNVIIPEALENLGAAVEEATEWLKEQAEAAYEAFVDAAYEAVKEYAPKVADAIYDYLYNNPEEVIAFVREYGDDFVNFIAQYDEEILAVLGYIAYTYGDDIVNFVIENHEEILDTMIAWYEVHGENTWALIDVYLEALGVYDAAEDLYEDLEDKLNEAAGDIMDAIEDAIAELEAEIEKLEGIVEELKAELEDLKAELENAAEDAKAEIEAAIAQIEKAIEEIEAVIETLKEKLEELYQIAEDIYNATQDVIDALLQANEDVEAALKALQEALEDLADAVEAAEKFLSELNDAVASVVGTIADIIERIAEISAECGEAVAEIVDAVIYILENAEEIVAGIQDAIEEAAELVAELVENFKEALFNATHATVYGCAVDSYVALGGAAVEADGYVAALGEELGVEPTNLGDATVNFTTLVDYVTENAAAIYGANVITYQMEATAFITTFVDALMNDLSLDIYWDENVQVYVDKIEEALMEKLAEEYDEQTLEIAAPIAKKLVYAMGAYAVESIEALETINTINPKATVLVVGMYNPLAGVTVILDGEEIDIGEMAEYVIDATELYYLVYAVASGNVKFVDASDTEVTGVVPEINIDAIEAAITAIMEMIANSNGLEDLKAIQAAVEALTAELYGMYDSIVTAEGSQEDIYDNIMDVLTVESHKWNAGVVTAPTCTKDGYTTYTCSKCGETYTADETGALGHDYVDGVCTRCGDEEDKGGSVGPTGGSSRDWHCPTCKSDTCHSKAFSDLDLDAWYHEYTDYVLCKGMMNGMGGDIFAPNGETSRAMLTTILYRMAGSPAVTGEMPFADVAAGQWYSDAILWAAQNDVVLGYVDGNFGPMDTITREQIAAMFFRFAELKGMDTSKAADLASYKDAATVGAWATDYVEWAVSVGLMKGRAADTLAPAAGTTRAETAALLERWCEEIAD